MILSRTNGWSVICALLACSVCLAMATIANVPLEKELEGVEFNPLTQCVYIGVSILIHISVLCFQKCCCKRTSRIGTRFLVVPHKYAYFATRAGSRYHAYMCHELDGREIYIVDSRETTLTQCLKCLKSKR